MSYQHLVILFCCMAFAPRVSAQADVYPNRPSAGDTLRISYDLRNGSASLSGQEPVYAKVTVYRQDGGARWHTLLLTGKDTLRQYFVVPQEAASLAFRFYTLNKDDDKAARKLYVYDKSIPVQSAYLEDFFSGNSHIFFEKEISQYPLNYLAYARYFNVLSMYKGAEESRQAIEKLLPALEKAYRENTAPGAALLTALCVGYAKSGRLHDAKALLFRLLKDFPQREETLLAFSLYNYEYYKSSGRLIEEDVKRQLAVIYKQWPESPLTGEPNVTHYLMGMQDVTTAHFEKALLPRIEQGTLPYYGFEKLPDIYIARREKPDSAKTMLLKFIRLFQDGNINHQYRFSPDNCRHYVSYFLQKLAAVNLWQQEYSEAVSNASAAMALLAGNNMEGNFLPDLLAIRAAAYRGMGNLNMALADYRQLYDAGKKEALDSVNALLPYCTAPENNTVKRFSATAPDFTGKDLSGRTIRLSALKGKIVVINFWGTGCGPCIGEMPELNKLVRKYVDSSKVVFLALTNDPTNVLQQFFKKREFSYTIVNDTGNATSAYNIESLPVHIVVGPGGEIVNRSTGAREDIFDYLDAIINRLHP